MNTKGITAPQWLVDAAATKVTAAEMQNWLYYTTDTLDLLPHLYTDKKRVELMECMLDQQTHVHSHLMVKLMAIIYSRWLMLRLQIPRLTTAVANLGVTDVGLKQPQPRLIWNSLQ